GSLRAERQVVGGARGICGRWAARVGTAAPCHFASAPEGVAAGANGTTAGASESTVGPAVMHAAAHGHSHSHGSFAGGGGTLPFGSAPGSLPNRGPRPAQPAAPPPPPPPPTNPPRA